MGDLATLVPGGTALAAFATVIGILIKYLINDRRLLVQADQRYTDEAKQHEATQQQLDDERGRRRKAEDDLANMVREVAGLREQVAEQTRQVAKQTAKIAHLEQEVARLTGSAAA